MTFGEWIAVVASLIIIVIFFGSLFMNRNSSNDSMNSSSDIEVSTSTDATPAAGLKIEDTKVGTGPAAKSGDTLLMHYVGTLTDGKKFDSSRDRGEPLEFTLGIGQVIKGWDQGVLGMKVGGQRKLTIPPELGYGARGAGSSIPPNATLIFEIELVEIK